MSTSETHVIEQLSAYVDGMIPETGRAEIDAHLMKCADCERHYQQLLHLRKAVHDQPTFTPPESFYQGALARIDAQTKAESWLRGHWTAKGLASACLVMLVVWVTRKEPTKEREAVMAAPAISAEKQKMEAPVVETPLIDKIDKLVNAPPPPEPVVEPKADVHPMANKVMAKKAVVAKSHVTMARVVAPAQAPAAGFAMSGLPAVSKGGPKAVEEVEVSSLKDSSMDVRLPSAVSKLAPNQLIEWKGVDSGIKKFKTFVIHSPEELEDVWAKHAPSENAPTVDFDHFIVVGITSGLRHVKGQGMDLMGTRETTDAQIIYYREAADLFRQFPVMSTYTPYHFKVIPKSDRPVQFQKI